MAEGKQNLQNAAIIAKLFGVTDRRIQQLAKEGIIPAAQKRDRKSTRLNSSHASKSRMPSSA